MKIALITDIHGNTTALRKVLADIENEKAETTICLGDSFINGPNPIETLRILKEHNIQSVRGNTEDFITDAYRSKLQSENYNNLKEGLRKTVAWCCELFSEADIAYLESLPLTISLRLSNNHQLLCYHATPDSNTGLIRESSDEELFQKIIDTNPETIFAGGHTHVTYLKKFKGRTFLNPGSLGMPIALVNDDKSYHFFMGTEYTIINVAENGSIDFVFKKIAIDREEMLAEVNESNMPDKDIRIDMLKNAVL